MKTILHNIIIKMADISSTLLLNYSINLLINDVTAFQNEIINSPMAETNRNTKWYKQIRMLGNG
ncbi:hypothetical protein BpHYR1_054420 [Brachionus plicatilis]|uniref:Uncharacterized protein n=1 Tax=Brachionus plicatilis TaxID=10195 RepID=A0A3M7PY56_BRAPC|nr:hypothetical protein BpHYR1_054420 [Brachionus plicatilis]